MHTALIPASTGLDILAADAVISPDTIKMFKELLVRLPDLIIYRPSPTGDKCYPCSKTVNKIVDQCLIYDYTPPSKDYTDVYAWPCTIINSFRVFSDPPSIIIGRVNTAGFGVVATPDLEKILDNNEIAFKAVRIIRDHLRGRPEISYM